MLTRYSTLLLALLLLFLSTALSEQLGGPGNVVNVLFTLVAFSGVYVASSSRQSMAVSVGLGLVWILLLWIEPSQVRSGWRVADSIVGVVFLGYTVFLMLKHIFHAKKVDNEILAGAATAYLLLALAWTFLFSLLVALEPESFSNGPHEFFALLYFSLTTMTTLGYGDLLPMTPIAQIAAVLEAAVGVLFTTILIGRLIGVHIAGVSQTPEDS